MNPALEEYIAARTEWATALQAETTSKIAAESARHRFILARAALRAEETELLEAKTESQIALENILTLVSEIEAAAEERGEKWGAIHAGLKSEAENYQKGRLSLKTELAEKVRRKTRKGILNARDVGYNAGIDATLLIIDELK